MNILWLPMLGKEPFCMSNWTRNTFFLPHLRLQMKSTHSLYLLSCIILLWTIFFARLRVRVPHHIPSVVHEILIYSLSAASAHVIQEPTNFLCILYRPTYAKSQVDRALFIDLLLDTSSLVFGYLWFFLCYSCYNRVLTWWWWGQSKAGAEHKLESLQLANSRGIIVFA